MSENTLYNGSSDGFSELSDGYIDYAREIIARRSLPDIRDGLKPVGRRIIYACSNQKGIYDSLTKCGTLVGKVMEIHPHGDSSIYQALCNMTDANKGMNVPLFEGQGNFGDVYSTDKPAAMRYTKAKLNSISKDYLRDLDACTMVPSEEGEGFEPEVFPVRFPAALVNGTSGMAVSVSTSIPSFNLLDVINLTQERIKSGECCTSIITPDFPTGGVIVKDDAELTKIMMTGKGRLKIRAKVEIAGKEILVKEVPYGKTVEGIIRAIDKSEIDGIQSSSDATGNNSEYLIRITCKSMKVVEKVLLQLYRHRILQTSFSSNMLFVENEEPVITGVYGVVDKWLEYRRKIVAKKFNQSLDSISSELIQLDYFIRLIRNAEWRDTFVDKVVQTSKNEGKVYLKEIFEDIPDDVCNWIADRSLSAFNNGGSYANRYSNLKDLEAEYKGYIENVDEYIYQDLEDLKRTRSEFFTRKSDETYLDYRFSKLSDNEMEDDSFCVYTLYKDGFLKKTRDSIEDSKDIIASISAQANSTLIGFDCFGRLLRVYGTDIPFTGLGERGEYLPRYFEAEGYDGYKVLYMGLLDGKKRMLVYKDGFVGFLDTSEFVGKKKIRTVQRGVDTNVYNALVEVIEEDDFPEYLVVAEDSGKKIRFGVTKVSQIREASRKSRAKVFGGSNLDIRYVAGMKYMELLQFMEEPFHYLDKLKPLGNRAVYGDASVVMKEGRYYEQW